MVRTAAGWLRRTTAIFAALGTLAFCLAATAQTQGWRVTKLEVGGAAADAAAVQVRASRGGPLQARSLRVNDTLGDVVEIRAEPHVEIELLSPSRMTAVKRSGFAALEFTTVDKGGDAVDVKQGRWSFSRATAALGQALSPFTATAGPHAARTPGTIFTVDVDEAAGVVRFQVQQGVIQVSQRVQAEVTGVSGAVGGFQRQLLTPSDPELSLPLSPSGWLRRFGNFDEALAAFEAQVRAAEARRDTDARFDALVALGDMRLLAGRPKDAMDSFEQALTLVPAPADVYWQGMLKGRIGAALQGQNRFSEAARAFRESLDLNQSLPRRDGEWGVEVQSTNITLNLSAAGTYRCADEWAQRLLKRLDDLRAGQLRHVRSPLWSTRGSAALALQRKTEARQWHLRALDAERTLAGIEGNKATPQLVAALNMLGQTETQLGNAPGAETLHREAMALLATLFSTPNPLKADTHLGLADAMRARRQFDAALGEIAQAMAVLDALPPDASRKGGAWLLKAEVLRESGRTAEAVQAYRESRGLWATVWPEASHPSFHLALLPGLSRSLRAVGAPAVEIAEVDAAARRGAEVLKQQEAQCPK